MPLYVQHTTGSAPSNSDAFGNIYVVGGALQQSHSYGPSDETGFYAGIDPAIGGYVWYRYITGSCSTYSRVSSTIGGAPNSNDAISLAPGGTNPNFTTINIAEQVDSASLARLRETRNGRIFLTQPNNGVSGSYKVTNATLQSGIPNYTVCTVTTTFAGGGNFTTGGGGGALCIGEIYEPTLSIYSVTSDEELKDAYNITENVDFSNALEAKDAIAENDNYLLEGEPIRDGLVLYFDPNNDNSYKGTGTTVHNVAPAATALNITGVLDAGNMYINPGGGDPAYFRVRSADVIARLEFQDSSGNDYTIQRPANEDNTLMFFFWSDYQPKDQYSYSQAFFGGKYTNYMALQLHTASSGISYRPEAETNGAGGGNNHDYFALPAQEGPVFPTASWGSWTSVIERSATASNWFNGFPGQGDDGNNNYPLTSSQAIHSFRMLGSTSTGTTINDRGGDIRMGALLMYNRVLTEEEIRFNLNLFEQRYQ